MPNFDGTGPRGKGARTGRGLGKCGITEIKVNNLLKGADNSAAGKLKNPLVIKQVSK